MTRSPGEHGSQGASYVNHHTPLRTDSRTCGAWHSANEGPLFRNYYGNRGVQAQGPSSVGPVILLRLEACGAGPAPCWIGKGQGHSEAELSVVESLQEEMTDSKDRKTRRGFRGSAGSIEWL